jgi:hypothetical protein
MHIDSFTNRRDLDAGHEGDARRAARLGRGVAAGDRVVIGHAEHGDAGGGCARDELRRGADAIRRGCMGVEIDQRDFAATREARPRRL